METATPRSEVTELDLRLDLIQHSPTGLEWGYGGAGPAQLALALLADALGNDEQAIRLHQTFKWQVVASLPLNGWLLSLTEVRMITHSFAEALQTKKSVESAQPL